MTAPNLNLENFCEWDRIYNERKREVLEFRFRNEGLTNKDIKRAQIVEEVLKKCEEVLQENN